MKVQLREAWFAAIAEWKDKAIQEAGRQVRKYSQKETAELWDKADKDRYRRTDVQIVVIGPRVPNELDEANADLIRFRHYLELLDLTDEEDLIFTGPLKDLPRYL